MTKSLEEALEKVSQLSEDTQNTIAALILEEIEDELKWNEAFANSQPQLSALAKKVRADIQAGRVRDGGFGNL